MGQKLFMFWEQSFFIPPPTFTDKDLPDQTGKVLLHLSPQPIPRISSNYIHPLFYPTTNTSQVHLITGGYAGIAYHLTRILYSKNATIYLAGRSEAKARASISRIEAECPGSKGRLVFLYLDLADLTSIKPAVEKFLGKEERLDVLVNNAAIMVPPTGSKYSQVPACVA
jgi:retinol dehydrogenase-12